MMNSLPSSKRISQVSHVDWARVLPTVSKSLVLSPSGYAPSSSSFLSVFVLFLPPSSLLLLLLRRLGCQHHHDEGGRPPH